MRVFKHVDMYSNTTKELVYLNGNRGHSWIHTNSWTTIGSTDEI